MEEIAVLCQKAENQYVGVSCGIMDQFIAAAGKKDHAIFLNCDTLEYQYVPLKLDDYTIVITNTNKPHKHTESKYEERHRECKEALAVINQNGGKYKNLCDISLPELEKFKACFQSGCTGARGTARRNALSLHALKAAKGFGALMKEANISMRTTSRQLAGA